MEQRPNNYDGFSYALTDPADLEKLDQRAAILLEPGQIAFFKQYPNSLTDLVKKAAQLEQVPNLVKWLASLWNKPLVLEVHTSSDMYAMDAVWLRFKVQNADPEESLPVWHPAINLLSYNDPRQVQMPELLNQVFYITGEINLNGYGAAGRLHHPDRIGSEVSFYETFKNDKAFYQLPDMDIFYEFHGGFYQTEEERQTFGLRRFEKGLAHFLNLIFENLLNKKEFRLKQDGGAVKE